MTMADVLMLRLSRPGDGADEMAASAGGRVFECKTCYRQFPTFQALGGHRTGHRKPKPAGAGSPAGAPGRGGPKARVHGCSICGLEFEMGQALGGHMRRHRAEVEAASSQRPRSCTEKAPRLAAGDPHCPDLNLPPAEDDDDAELLTWGLGVGLTWKVPSVVGCRDTPAISY